MRNIPVEYEVMQAFHEVLSHSQSVPRHGRMHTSMYRPDLLKVHFLLTSSGQVDKNHGVRGISSNIILLRTRDWSVIKTKLI